MTATELLVFAVCVVGIVALMADLYRKDRP